MRNFRDVKKGKIFNSKYLVSSALFVILNLFCLSTYAISVPATSTGSYTVSFQGYTNTSTTSSSTSTLIQTGTNNSSYFISPNINSKTFTDMPSGTYHYKLENCTTYDWVGTLCDSDFAPLTTVTVVVTNTPAPGPLGVPGQTMLPSISDSGYYPVSWGSATGSLTSYKLEELEEDVAGANWTTIQNIDSREFSVTGKTKGSYSYRVSACNGVASLDCGATNQVQTVQVIPPLHVPEFSTGTHTVSWAPNYSYNFNSYHLTENGVPVYFGGTDLSVTLENRGSGSYIYKLKYCHNSAGCINQVVAQVTTQVDGVPRKTAIEMPDSHDVLTGSYAISWYKQYTTTYFNLKEKLEGDEDFTQVYSGPLSSQPFNNPPGKHSYIVQGCNSLGCSPWSSERLVAVDNLANIIDTPPIQIASSVGAQSFSAGVSENGSASISVPIQTVNGVGGLKPSLSIGYSSSAVKRLRELNYEDTILGYGWGLGGISSIRRCKTATEDDTSSNLCLDGEALVRVTGSPLGDDSEYRTETDSYIRVFARGTTQTRWFEVHLANGHVRKYGDTNHSRTSGGTDMDGQAFTPNDEPYLWGMTEELDDFGNILTVDWWKASSFGSIYPLSINYANASVTFSYNIRDDLSVTPGLGDSATQMRVSLNKVLVSVDGVKVREYRLDTGSTLQKRVEQIQHCAYDSNGSNATCLQPLIFGWTNIPGAPENFEEAITTVDDGHGEIYSYNYAVIDGSGDSNDDGIYDTDHSLHESIYGEFGNLALPSNVEERSTEERVLVSSFDQPDGIGGLRTLNYYYSGYPLYDTNGRGFVGFPQTRIDQLNVPVYDPVTSSNKSVDLITRRQHRLDVHLYGETARSVSSFIDNGVEKIISRQEMAWRLKDRGINSSASLKFPYIAAVYSWNYQLNGAGSSQLSSTTKVESQYCYYSVSGSNPCPTSGTELEHPTRTKTVSYFGSSLGGYSPPTGNTWGDIGNRVIVGQLKYQEKTTNYINHITPTEWVIGFTSRTQSGFGVTSAQEFDEVIYTKLANASSAIDSTTRFPGDAEFELTQGFTYDSFGNSTSSTISGADIVSRTTASWGHAVNKNMYPSNATNAAQHDASFEYEMRFGAIRETTDANGLTSSVQRDDFGRVISTTGPDGSHVSKSFESCALVDCSSVTWATPRFRITTSASNGIQIAPTSRQYVDTRGRVVLTESQAFSASDGWVRVETHYDSLGRAFKSSLPYFSTSGAPQYVMAYFDHLSRPIQVTNPGSSAIRTNYQATGSGDTTITSTIVDTNRIKQSRFNSLGQVVEVVEALGATEEIATDYFYNPRGLLERVNVDGIEVAHLSYDRAGNRDQILEPNTGITSYDFNALGQLQSSTDFKGQVTEFDYDLLGRVIQRMDDKYGANQAINNWQWDTATNGIGALASRSNEHFSETYQYNNDSRIQNVNTNISVPGVLNHQYEKNFGYDQLGRVSTINYPGGFETTQTYSDRGYNEKLFEGTTQLQAILEKNAFNQTTLSELGDQGMQTQRGYDGVGRLTTIQSGNSTTPKSIQDIEYKWNSDNSLYQTIEKRSTTSAADDVTDTFSYDGLMRLTSQATTGTANRALVFDYDQHGNMLQKQTTSGTSPADIDANNYNYNSAISPHRLIAVDIAGVNNILNYDANGNITQYDSAVGDDTFIEYSGLNQVTQITLGDSASAVSPTARDEFWYDPDGARFLHRESWQDNGTETKLTTYIGNFEEIRRNNSDLDVMQITDLGNVRHFHRASFFYQDDSWFEYIHRDRQGSIDAVTDEAGNMLTKVSFDVFGGQREADLSQALSFQTAGFMLQILDERPARGYTGHEHLPRTGFIHMNGRVYDPRISRFLSPDPVNSRPYNSQRYNKYSYVMNNPTAYTDPTGYSDDDLADMKSYDNVDREGPGNGAITGVTDIVYAAQPIYIGGNVHQGALAPGIGFGSGVNWASAEEVERFLDGYEAGYIETNYDKIRRGIACPGSNIKGSCVTRSAYAKAVRDSGVARKEGLIVLAGMNAAQEGGNGKQVVSDLVNSAGLFSSAALLNFISGNGTQWKGKNGKWNGIGWGGNRWTGARSEFLRRANQIKTAGKGFFILGTGLSLYDGSNAFMQGDSAGVLKAGSDIGWGTGATFGGPVGLAGGIGYFGASMLINIPAVRDITVVPITNVLCSATGNC